MVRVAAMVGGVAASLGATRSGVNLGAHGSVLVLVACGEPIPCPKTEEPSKELINEYHAKLMAGYQAVFEQHKAAYGWENRSLKLVD